MPPQIDKLINAFRQAVQFSTPLAANVIGKEVGDTISVSTVWSQSNIESKMKMNSYLFQTVDVNTSQVNDHGCAETTGQLLSSYSPSNLLRAIVKEVPATGKTPKKQFIEVWKGNLMFKQFDLQSLDLHGEIYTDADFSCFEWSMCEEQILYLAEKKQPKTESFLSTKPNSEGDCKVIKGNEYLFSQDWGEQLVGKCKSVLAVADLVRDEIRLIEVKEGEHYFYGTGTWAPGGGVIAVAYIIEPRRLGKVYCTNRPSFIVHITPDGELTKLSDPGMSVFGPKVSPDKSKLIWFQRETSGPHHSCVKLIKYDWDTKKASTVVDIVMNESKCTGGQPFYGLYNHICPNDCWLSDNKTVILSTPQRASVKTFAIDTDVGIISEIDGAIDEEYSQGTLQVWKNYVLCWRSSLQSFPGVYIAKIDPMNLDNVKWIPLVSCKNIEENYNLNILRFEGETWNDPTVSVKNYSAIYFGPKSGESVPLIVWSHGGPHGNSTNVFNLNAHYFAKLGFAMLMVNYRGSIGAGKANVDHLLGRIGTSDVSDVHLAHQFILKSVQNIAANKCVLYGGSYGGYLSLHLAGQLPNDFVSCTAINPATNLAFFSSSDIPDWAFVENNLNYSPLAKISGAEIERMWKVSPDYYAENVKIPVLILVGSKDLRVPPHSGINYYYTLNEIGKAKTKLLLYEDNHKLGQSAHETDFLINTASWFLESIDHTVE